MKPIEQKELVDKYLKGECSPLEERLLHEWYNSFDSCSEPLAMLNEKEKSLLKKRMFNRIIEKTQIEQPVVRNLNPYYYAVASVAAVLLLFFTITFYTSSDNISAPASKYAGQILFKNSSNKLVKHLFPDGSIAWVRPATEISYSAQFNSGAIRYVSMTGEAFFEVTKNPKRPFIIQTGHVFTKVLGTSFNVKCYKGDQSAEVSVVTGKVLVYKSSTNKSVHDQETYLLPREKVITFTEGKHFVKKQETDNAMKMWQKNTLSFNNEPVSRVVKALNERFKTEIVIKDDQINGYQLTADFTDVNLPSALELLSKSLGITYEINNYSITMSNTN